MTQMSSVCEGEASERARNKCVSPFVQNIIPVRIVSTTTRVFIAHRAHIRRFVDKILFSLERERECVCVCVWRREKEQEEKKEFLSFCPPIGVRRCHTSVSLAHPSVAYHSLKLSTLLLVLLFPLGAVRATPYSRVAKNKKSKTEKNESISARKKSEDERCLRCVCACFLSK
jgi:hypothetical protein